MDRWTDEHTNERTKDVFAKILVGLLELPFWWGG